MFGFAPSVPEIDVHEAYACLGKEGCVLIDVRTPGEVQQQGIPGAINIPLDQLEQAAGQLAGYKTINVICRSGSRSAMATQMLHHLGLSQARTVSGGLTSWAHAGLPTA